MENIRYRWNTSDGDRVFELAFGRGTHGRPYSCGGRSDARRVEIRDFFIGTVPVTQALWIHVGGPLVNPSVHQGANLPLENVSWDEITRDGGFLSRINGSRIHASIVPRLAEGNWTFRLPSETESGCTPPEGGRIGLTASGSAAAMTSTRWHGYTGNTASGHSRLDRRRRISSASTICLAMSGSGARTCSRATSRACLRMERPSSVQARIVCFGAAASTNWAVHCTVSKRYEIAHDYHDGCIGFRLVLADDTTTT